MMKAKKKVAKKKISKKIVIKKYPAMARTEKGLYVPEGLVKSSPLQKGIKKAAQEINSTIDNILKTLSRDVIEIELTLGFSADGKFMGFGAGGDMSIKVKLDPHKRLTAS